tara:strand:- start:180 stop:455 length:276 start_codon:yes stop_codon:yes gene_type:complete
MENNIINKHTIVFTLSEDNQLKNIPFSVKIRNFIANFSNVDIYTLSSIKNNLIKFGSSVKKNMGRFVIVSNYSYDDKLNIVSTLQEAQDFI